MTQKYLKNKKSKSFNISNFFTIGLVLVALPARLTRLGLGSFLVDQFSDSYFV
jgi:hypothetical protein